MPAEYFLDTNVFVYTFDSSAPAKRKRARELVREALDADAGVISWHVAQEFVNDASCSTSPGPASGSTGARTPTGS